MKLWQCYQEVLPSLKSADIRYLRLCKLHFLKITQKLLTKLQIDEISPPIFSTSYHNAKIKLGLRITGK